MRSLLFFCLASCTRPPLDLGPDDTTFGAPTGDTSDIPERPAGWALAAPLLSPLQENSVVTLGGEIVVVGGFGANLATTARVEGYDPVADRWRSLPDLPETLHHANSAVVDGRLYVVGGLDSLGFTVKGSVYIYDPASGWSVGPSLPGDRAVGSAVVGVIDGRIHLVGGFRDGGSQASHTVYDPASGLFEQLPDAPLARNHAAGGVIDGQLVVVGGRALGIEDVLDTVEIYDPASGWRTGAPMPTARGGIAAAALDGALHVFGGEGAPSASGVFADHESYDLASDTWTAHPPMATPRHGTGASALAGTIWVPGGAEVQAFGAGDINESWAP